MSDLSRLLDDVYGTTPEPTWTTDTAEVFSGWLPERPADEPPKLHVADPVEALEAILEQEADDDDPVRSPAPAPVVAEVEEHPAPKPRPTRAVLDRGWSPSDDDILPAKPPRRRFRFRFRR